MKKLIVLILSSLTLCAPAVAALKCSALVFEGKSVNKDYSAILDGIEVKEVAGVTANEFRFLSASHPRPLQSFRDFAAAEPGSKMSRGFEVQLTRAKDKLSVAFFLQHGEKVGTFVDFPVRDRLVSGSVLLVVGETPVQLTFDCIARD